MIIIDGIEYLDLKEASSAIGVAEITLRTRVRAKEAPKPIKLKAVTYWKKSEIDEYLEKTRSGCKEE
jgi:predicted DNA-binding transcriptional regulator AlpA